ncbi:MAG: capsular biosynthesis protein [Hyphomicrobium sp.]|nr:MAG: capsular biosynthesis protein [Hyphomicrobium sp.]
MRILITGSDGFIGTNLRVRLAENGITDVARLTRTATTADLDAECRDADFVFHLAGVNRPKTDDEFDTGNAGLTQAICERLVAAGRKAPIVYTSSTQASKDNPYGRSKRAAEAAVESYASRSGAPAHIFRLTNVFGKWSRPNYNSAVATFCSQIAAGETPTIHDPAAPLRLIYVDDVVSTFIDLLESPAKDAGLRAVEPVYDTSVGEVVDIIRSIAASRTTLLMPRAGSGLVRALNATYLSFLKPQQFVYDVPRHSDQRGEFVEMLKTSDSGQFSYFTAHPGVTRGEHYHHSKTEKFLVLQGTARFGFRHIVTGECHQIVTRGGEGRIVETVPGWVHSVTNAGTDELIVMLWANEIFNRDLPDTIAQKVDA